MPSLEVALGTLPLPIWAVGAAAALLFVAAIVAFQQAGARGVARLCGRAALVLIALGAGWTYLDRSAVRERMAERRALDQRMVELTAHAIAPNSALACLDAMAGDTVEAACEKSVFASPEAIAAAVSYVAARLTLLADAEAYAEADPGYETVLAPMRLALETDRFGIVAHVFAVRDSCTALQCDSLGLLRDTSRVQSNLKERTFDHYITRYAADWPARGMPAPAPVAEKGRPSTLASTGSVPAAGVPPSSRYDFPSAASIPPVSIMNPEPGQGAAATAPAASGTTAAPKPATAAAVPAPPRRPVRTTAPRSPAPESAPVQLSPPPAAAGQTAR